MIRLVCYSFNDAHIKFIGDVCQTGLYVKGTGSVYENNCCVNVLLCNIVPRLKVVDYISLVGWLFVCTSSLLLCTGYTYSYIQHIVYYIASACVQTL